jgi:Fe-S oxidoreductase
MASPTQPHVAIMVTCLVDMMRPTIGFATVKLLEDAGCKVSVPLQTCCGQPNYNSGDREGAKSLARAMIEGRSLRLNRKHVQRVSEMVCIGDVLTVMVGNEIRVIEVLTLPDRRASPDLAKNFYRDLTESDQA